MIDMERIRFIADNIDKFDTQKIERDGGWMCETCANRSCDAIYKMEWREHDCIKDRAWLCEECKAKLDRIISGYSTTQFKESLRRLISLSKKH